MNPNEDIRVDVEIGNTDDLASRIIVHELLSLIQHQDAETGRSAAIEPDEHALLPPLVGAFGIRQLVAESAIHEYFQFRRGHHEAVERAVGYGENGEAYQRLQSLSHIMHNISARLANPEDRWFGIFTPAEHQAFQYLDAINQAKQQKEFVPFNRRGLSLGNIAALQTLLDGGNYGSFFGCPVDDIHTFSKETVHPFEIFVPLLAKFYTEHYSPDNTVGFLSAVEGPLSGLLHDSFFSRAYQATLAEKGEIILDHQTKQRCTITRDYLPLFLTSIFNYDGRDIGNYIVQHTEQVMHADNETHEEVSLILDDPSYKGHWLGVAGLRGLIGLRVAYDQIAADNKFSQNEYAMMEHAMERLGIRRQDTRDLLLGIERLRDGTPVTEPSLDNLDKLYGSKFFQSALHK